MAQPSKIARDFILLLTFTALRRSEGSNLRWSNIDFEKKTLTIPPGYNKSQREHILPMTQMVEAILESRKPLKGWNPSKGVAKIYLEHLLTLPLGKSKFTEHAFEHLDSILKHALGHPERNEYCHEGKTIIEAGVVGIDVMGNKFEIGNDSSGAPSRTVRVVITTINGVKTIINAYPIMTIQQLEIYAIFDNGGQ